MQMLSRSRAKAFHKYMSLGLSELHRISQKHELHRFGPIILAPTMVLLLLATMGKYSYHHTMVRRSLVSIMPQVIMSTTTTQCKRNAIVYFAESTAAHNRGETTALGQLTKSLDLLFENYLLDNYQSTSVILFHAGDFGADDLAALELRYPAETRGTMQLVNLVDTRYWTLPISLSDNEAALDLSGAELVAAHKTRFFTTGIYDYLEQINHLHGCSYENVLQLKGSSFIYSKIEGDLFADMRASNHMLQYRMCETANYEYDTKSSSETSPQPGFYQLIRDYAYTISRIHLYSKNYQIGGTKTCAPSSSFLLSSLHYMNSRPVQRFLSFCESRIYTMRLSQSNIVAGLTFGLLEEHSVHRLLDFTFASLPTIGACPVGGTLQAGYKDVASDRTLSEFMYVYETNRHCEVSLTEEHVVLHVDGEFDLSTITVPLISSSMTRQN